MPAFSEDQVIALAPDAGSAKSGRDLAMARKWVRFAALENAVWGECQGSAALPYQTVIDLSEPAFKCSCPSRKFPCKHGLALLLLFARQGESFEESDTPEWVSKWLQTRNERMEKKARKKDEAAESPADPAAKAKRQNDRLAKVEAGLAEFRLWLQDRIRQGLSGLESQPYQFFENAAARLTDAQAPGLARQMRQCAGIPNTGEGWQTRLLERFSLMHLAAEGFTRIAELPPDLQQDLRSIIGFTTNQDEVLKQEGVKDRWQIIGQRVDIDDRLKTQRTWLRGENSGLWALVLNFAFGVQPLDISLTPGFVIDAELVFFPAAFKLRALIKSRSELAEPLKVPLTYDCADSFLTDYASALSLNPWIDSFPVAIANALAGRDSRGKFMVLDAEKNLIPVSITDGIDWQILALTGGHPFSLFGEWNGESLLPLSIFAADRLMRIDARPLTNAN